MGIEAISRRDDGSSVKIPMHPDDWRRWVSAGRTRNWMMKDPLVDWLQMYGRQRGYAPSSDLPGYNWSLDFLEFIFTQGREFEYGILRLFADRFDVVTIAESYEEIADLSKAEETFRVMNQGAAIVYQAVLWDAESLTYGSPDFLVRSDILLELFPECMSAAEAALPAPALDTDGWHYRVVDTKFTTLHFNAAGTELLNGGSTPAYKAQLYIYDRMLARLQDLEPSHSYLLGRGWQIGSGRTAQRGSSAFDRLGPVRQKGSLPGGISLGIAVEQALEWVRRLRAEGAQWDLLPRPSVPELYPNMTNADDGGLSIDLGSPELEPGGDDDDPVHQWSNVKQWLADELKELTQLWRVGVPGRKQAHDAGVYRWDAPGLTPTMMEVRGPQVAPTLKQIIAVNTDDGLPLRPQRISQTTRDWFTTPKLEFYVDFEYCSDLNDDFSMLPAKGGQPLIFMIGCGHMENEQWNYRSFVVERLVESDELLIIQEWIDHMSAVRGRINPSQGKTRIFHWSFAEPAVLERNYNSAKSRHPASADWPEFEWYDFMSRVVRREPVVVRGALGFGLKAVARAMRSHGMIETDWADSPIDGLGAMVGAWRCDEDARDKGQPMSTLPLMKEIVRYNEVDCRTMMEIVRYLRLNC